ncbi:poly(A)-specific ribonuclease PNLDC1 isoform X1 [Anolis carolinensis]|uniref:Poly(A)-specific ribonuclease PNLDC1 n=3 Tax=Anolis carolinensis TaxID=28377 RepID=G1KP33_ANOCA|nr:PREDICTED: poly(A)-specific ribonuclease PARN-like domain-containing protein 1 [Anolis carolinensis]|eukprot:XP_008121494.1 PREDICTED: poly(A)-specific ribonuclease PARN-like domain-containing protein 1 [Anolis carolinensis]
MDICASQFEERLPELQELLSGCDFVGLDMEFTGLRSVLPDRQPSFFDSPAEWYQKARQSIQQFTVSQLGLSIFCRETSTKYVAHSYNFFLFPTTFGQIDSELSFQASSIQFLSHYGFDFNKFLKDGIPYMNETQEKKMEHLVPGSWMVRSGFGKDKLKKVIEEVTCWVSSAEEKDSMVLHDLYDFQMFEVQLILRQAIKDIWTIPLGDHKVLVKKMNPHQRWLLENTSYDSCQKEQIILCAKGFTNLFQALVKAKKPLVGHNMMMDLLHLHEKFYNPLPENYEEFKKNMHTLFPIILDTKNISKSIWKEFQFPQASSLSEVYEELCSVINTTNQSCPEIFHARDCLRYTTKMCLHEAAYDAFLCGSVLLKIAHLLFCNISCDNTRAASYFSQYLDVLSTYVNQVNLIRASIQKINFSGLDDHTKHLPLLIANVRRWPGVNEEQIHRELGIFCRFDVRRLRMNQFLLLSNRLRNIRMVLEEYKTHPNLQISLYYYWRHAPEVNCFLQICGIVVSWSLLAFFLGGSSSCAV